MKANAKAFPARVCGDWQLVQRARPPAGQSECSPLPDGQQLRERLKKLQRSLVGIQGATA